MKTFVLVTILLLGVASANEFFLDRLRNTEDAVKQQTSEIYPNMAPKAAEKKTVHQSEQGLKDAMRHMMDDDDEDDIEGSSANTAFLQSEQGSDAYMEESANSLSEALGPRWNSKELETTADQNTNALLKGIANPKALNGLNGMMNAMMSLR